MTNGTLQLTKTKNLGMRRSVRFDLSAPRDPRLALALAENKPFPFLPVTLGSLSLAAQGDVSFGRQPGKATFRAKAGADAGLAVSNDGASLIAGLKLDDQLSQGLALTDGTNDMFAMLRWGYDVSASGKVALDAGAGSFGIDAARTRTYAVIRRLAKKTGARSVVADMLESWIMPRQIDAAGKLAPGTWVITEVDGSFALSLEGQLGWNGNWIRQLTAGALSGEIGLRIQAGITARLGFSASGRFALVVARASGDPSDERVRLRLFKLRKKGWSFALDASASAQADTSRLLPSRLDSLVAGVLGLDSAQVMDDISALARWTDPTEPLTGLLAEAGTDYAKKLIRQVTGIDPETAFAEAQARMEKLFSAWDGLPNQITSRLWSLIGEKVDLGPLTSWLQQINQANTDSLEQLLAEKLGLTGFFRTPEGQWLSDALEGRLLAPLVDSKAVQTLQDRARKTLALLDGSDLQRALTRLQQEVSKRLGLDKIQQVVDQASFARMDDWLRAKLHAFLDRDVDLEGVEAVRTTIHNLLEKSQDFYDKAISALDRQYNVSFSATYQRATARTALIDVTFDLAHAGTGALLAQAIRGDFEQLLVAPKPGVTLGMATLTHDVSRQRAVAIHLPWGSSSVQQMNDSLAKLTVVDDDGRLMLYDLTASDTVTAVRRCSQNESKLTIGAHLKVPANRVRVRDEDGFSYRYTFSRATKGMHRASLQFELEPWIDAYFPSHFSAQGDGSAPGSFGTWLSDLDRRLETRASGHPDAAAARGTDNIGNTLLSLDLSLPSAAGAAWLAAPDGRDRATYAAMSRALQQVLRQVLSTVYFQDPKRFDDDVPAATLLTWAALPISSAARVSADGTTLRLNLLSTPFWDWPDPTLRRAMANSRDTAVNLAGTLSNVRGRLAETPGMDARARQLAPTPARVRRLVGSALGPGDPLLRSLLFVESRIITSARKAGVDLHRFISSSPDKPAKAIAALSNFGSEVTAAFNSRLRSVFVDNSFLRPFGTQLFLAAATAFDSKVAAIRPAALLDITVVCDGVTPFPPANFPNAEPLAKDQILTEQRLVATGSE